MGEGRVLQGYPGPDQGEGASEDRGEESVLRGGHQTGRGGKGQEGEDRQNQGEKDTGTQRNGRARQIPERSAEKDEQPSASRRPINYDVTNLSRHPKFLFGSFLVPFWIQKNQHWNFYLAYNM